MSERKELAARLRAVAEEMRECEWLDQNIAPVLRAADLLDPPARGRTVRVRIACAVEKDGTWGAAGGSGETIEESKADTGFNPGDLLVWIEADVPLPDETTVEGEVQP